MRRIRQNVDPAVSAYHQTLKEQPQEEDYAPGKMGKLFAGLSGLGAGIHDPSSGGATAIAQLRAPYKEAMGAYQTKLSGAREGANLAREDQQTQLKGISDAMASKLKYSEYKRQIAKDERDFGQKQKVDESTINKNIADVGEINARAKKLGQPEYVYEKQADGSILGINKNDTKDTVTIPAHTVEAGQLDVAKLNAGSAARQAGAAERNAATGEANSKNLGIYHDVMGKAATARAANSTARLTKPPTPYQQSRAVDMSLSILYSDPKFKKYIHKGGANEDPWSMTQDDGSPMYQEMKKQLKKHVENSLKAGSPFPGEGDDNQDDDVIDLSGPSRRR